MEFLDQMIDKLQEDQEEIDKEELQRPDLKPNSILQSFQKWEMFLKHQKYLRGEREKSNLIEENTRMKDSKNVFFNI